MASSSRPYPVCQSAPTEPTCTTACTTPPATSQHHRQRGPARPGRQQHAEHPRVGPAQQEHGQRDQPAEPDRHRGQVHDVGRARSRRHRRGHRVPGQRPGDPARPTAERRAGPAARARRAAARRAAPAAAAPATTASTASRAISAAPYRLPSTPASSAGDTPPRPGRRWRPAPAARARQRGGGGQPEPAYDQPDGAAAGRAGAARAAPGTAPARRPAPVRRTRGIRPAGTATATDRWTPPAWPPAARADGAPTEKVEPAADRVAVRRDHPVADQVRAERAGGRRTGMRSTAPRTAGTPEIRLPSGASTWTRPATGVTPLAEDDGDLGG